jgi:hypothetical protein
VAAIVCIGGGVSVSVRSGPAPSNAALAVGGDVEPGARRFGVRLAQRALVLDPAGNALAHQLARHRARSERLFEHFLAVEQPPQLEVGGDDFGRQRQFGLPLVGDRSFGG